MALITLERVGKYFGDVPVFVDVNLSVHAGERIGLIGVNGGGKSTLIDVLRGAMPPDEGERRQKRGLRIGMMEQLVEEVVDRTAYEEALEGASAARALEAELRSLENRMTEETDADRLTALATEYEETRTRFEGLGGEGHERFVEAALSGLGVRREQWDRKMSTLSSGQRVRVRLARLLQGDYEVLLLDEPTNHLDVEAIAWLAEALKRRPSSLVVVSHDRYFLDAVVTRVVEVELTKLHTYAGSFSNYLPTRTLRRQTALRAWEKQQDFIKKNADFVRRSAYGFKPAQAQARKKMLEKLDLLEKPLEVPTLRIRLPDGAAGRGEQLALRDISFGYAGEPSLFEAFSLLISAGDRIGLIGPNGSGKSTLLKVIAGRLATTAGEIVRSPKVTLSSFDQDLEDVNLDGTPVSEIGAALAGATEGEVRNRLGAFGFSGDDVFRPVRTFSGGERGRLGLLKATAEGGDVLLLDEPTNHLDIFTRQSFLEALLAFKGTVIMVSHDRYLIDQWATKIVRIDGPRTVVREGNLAEYEAFVAARDAAFVPSEPKRTPGKGGKSTATPGGQSSTRGKTVAPAAPKRKRRFWKLEDLEAAMMETEAALAATEARFSEPEVAKDGARVKALQQECVRLREELSTLEEEWESWM